MPIFQNTIVRKKNSLKTGNASAQTKIRVTDQFGDQVFIYSDPDFITNKSNPLKTDSKGFFEFYAPAGKYILEIGSPVIKKISIELYDAPEATIGITLLSNNSIGDKWLERDDSNKLIADYPDLAGTPGYEIDVTPGGIAFDSNYTSDEEISVPSITTKNAYVDYSKDRMYMLGTTQTGDAGAFLYSLDQGVTEDYASTVNTNNKFCLASNPSYIIIGGSGGNISVYSDVSLAYQTTWLAGTRTIRYVEYNSDNAIWIAVNDIGDIYVNSNPAANSWSFSNSISGLSGTGNYFEKTSAGYIIFDDTTNELKFCSSLLISPSASLVISSTTANIFFSKCSNNTSGNIIVVTQSPSGRMHFRSENGGQSFTEISPTGFDGNNLSDLIHAGNDVWVALFAFGATVQYTVDLGLTWVTASYTKPAGASNGNRLWANSQGDVFVSFTGDLTVRSKFASLTPPPTEFKVSFLESPSSFDKQYVKAK